MIIVKLIFFVSVLTLVGCKKDIFDSNNNMGGCTDIDALKKSGVKAIFTPGTPMQEIIDFVEREVRSD